MFHNDEIVHSGSPHFCMCQKWAPHRHPRYASNKLSVGLFVSENHTQCSMWKENHSNLLEISPKLHPTNYKPKSLETIRVSSVCFTVQYFHPASWHFAIAKNWTPYRNPRYAADGFLQLFFVDENPQPMLHVTKTRKHPKISPNWCCDSEKFLLSAPWGTMHAGIVCLLRKRGGPRQAMAQSPWHASLCLLVMKRPPAQQQRLRRSALPASTQRPDRPSHPRSPPPWIAALPSSPSPSPSPLLALLRVSAP